MAIFTFAVFGTIISTFMTGYMVYYGSHYLSSSEDKLTLLDSMIFGSLISSIDPVAILSVLSSLNLTEKDTIFIMVFGESLLNDGVAITLFKTLLTHYNSNTSAVSLDEILSTMADFLIVAVGSIVIGVICGYMALIYFWILRKKLNPSMEVASFFLWAGIPYYICDECNLSGIVAIVTIGFFMDIMIARPKDDIGGDSNKTRNSTIDHTEQVLGHEQQQHRTRFGRNQMVNDNYVDFGDSTPCNSESLGVKPFASSRSIVSIKSLRTLTMKELIMREEPFRLSREADRHVRFVAHLLSSLSENVIFVYLGMFLYSDKYTWDLQLICISIFSCITSRAAMVLIVCNMVWYINIVRQRGGCYKPSHDLKNGEPIVSRTATALQDRKIQLVLVLAGLRGAVSLALVESVPIHNDVTGTGSKFKGQMKAMTSASIMFTIFFIGGGSYYILRKLNIARDEPQVELTPIVERRTMKWKEAPKPEESLRKTHLDNAILQLPSSWD